MMKSAAATALLASSASAKLSQLVDESNLPISSPALIESVNNDPKVLWKAGANERFANWTVGDYRRVSGHSWTGKGYRNLPRIQYPPEVLAAVPDEFDPRVSRKECTGPVLDQGFCGSCWAFGAVEAISDRYCMSQLSQGKNATFLQLSPLDLVACNGGEDGCDGGMLEDAWQFANGEGLVTEECYPYLKPKGPVPTCKPEDQPCLPESKFINTPVCNVPDACPRPISLNNFYTISGVENMKAELVNKGPVESAFMVYADFPNYKSGVYHHTSGALLGGHAIKVIGYGTEGGTPYWLVQNSWTTTWGDGGYFKILQGTNECGIEDQFIAGDGF